MRKLTPPLRPRSCLGIAVIKGSSPHPYRLRWIRSVQSEEDLAADVLLIRFRARDYYRDPPVIEGEIPDVERGAPERPKIVPVSLRMDPSPKPYASHRSRRPIRAVDSIYRCERASRTLRGCLRRVKR